MNVLSRRLKKCVNYINVTCVMVIESNCKFLLFKIIKLRGDYIYERITNIKQFRIW